VVNGQPKIELLKKPALLGSLISGFEVTRLKALKTLLVGFKTLP
jgi:hypothetical protein